MMSGRISEKQLMSSLELTEHIITQLKKLPDGWGGESTKKPAPKALRKTKKILSCLEAGRMPFPAVNPMPNGCIILNWISPSREIKINVDGDGDMQFVTSLKKFDVQVGEIERLDSEGAVTDMLTIDHMMAWYCQDKAYQA